MSTTTDNGLLTRDEQESLVLGAAYSDPKWRQRRDVETAYGLFESVGRKGLLRAVRAVGRDGSLSLKGVEQTAKQLGVTPADFQYELAKAIAAFKFQGVEAAEDALKALLARKTIEDADDMERAGREGARTNEEIANADPAMVEKVQRAKIRAANSIAVATEPDRPGCRPCTDLGNAWRMKDLYGDHWRYCDEIGRFAVWDDMRFTMDNGTAIKKLAAKTARNISREAEEATGDRRGELLRWAARSESNARIESMMSLACTIPGQVVVAADLDANPLHLNVFNGTIELDTGQLRPHHTDNLITKLAPVRFNEHAKCPEFLRFLDRIMGGDAELAGFVQRAVGYSLTGLVGERCMFLMYGTGANGKSTLVETLRTSLGDYAQRAPSELFLLKRSGGVPNDVARLRGARFVTASETEEGRRMAEASVKDLTGDEVITARFMRAEYFEFKPSCKLWLATNHKPTVRGSDRAIWDRLRLIPFTVTIPENERDQTLQAKLIAEGPGILNWALEGCKAWQEDGLRPPDAVTLATSSYRVEMDTLGQFLDDCTEKEENATVTSGTLYQAYRDWCEDGGEKPQSQKWLGLRLKKRGVRPGTDEDRTLLDGSAFTRVTTRHGG